MHFRSCHLLLLILRCSVCTRRNVQLQMIEGRKLAPRVRSAVMSLEIKSIHVIILSTSLQEVTVLLYVRLS